MFDFWHIVRIIFYLLWGGIVVLVGTLACYFALFSGLGPYVFIIGVVIGMSGIFQMLRAWKQSDRARAWDELSNTERSLLLGPMANLFWIIPPFYFIWQMNRSPQFIAVVLNWIKQPTLTPTITLLLGAIVLIYGIFQYMIRRKSNPESTDNGYDRSYKEDDHAL